jgi:hypothetical protein
MTIKNSPFQFFQNKLNWKNLQAFFAICYPLGFGETLLLALQDL